MRGRTGVGLSPPPDPLSPSSLLGVERTKVSSFPVPLYFSPLSLLQSPILPPPRPHLPLPPPHLPFLLPCPPPHQLLLAHIDSSKKHISNISQIKEKRRINNEIT